MLTHFYQIKIVTLQAKERIWNVRNRNNRYE